MINGGYTYDGELVEALSVRSPGDGGRRAGLGHRDRAPGLGRPGRGAGAGGLPGRRAGQTGPPGLRCGPTGVPSAVGARAAPGPTRSARHEQARAGGRGAGRRPVGGHSRLAAGQRSTRASRAEPSQPADPAHQFTQGPGPDRDGHGVPVRGRYS
ncbi:hypothetical protein ACRAWF_15855 [Streptomyces sp. L7]